MCVSLDQYVRPRPLKGPGRLNGSPRMFGQPVRVPGGWATPDCTYNRARQVRHTQLFSWATIFAPEIWRRHFPPQPAGRSWRSTRSFCGLRRPMVPAPYTRHCRTRQQCGRVSECRVSSKVALAVGPCARQHASAGAWQQAHTASAAAQGPSACAILPRTMHITVGRKA